MNILEFHFLFLTLQSDPFVGHFRNATRIDLLCKGKRKLFINKKI